MSSYPSSTSYTPEKSAAALNILSNFGLEINDLALLADLPEELITAESLPRLLMEIKAKRMVEENTAMTTSRPRPSTPPSSPSLSRPAAVSKATQSLSNLLKQIRSQPVQYPLDHAYLPNKPVSPPDSSHKTAQMQPTIKTPIFSPPAQQYSRPMSAQSPVLSRQPQVKRDLAAKNNPTTSAYSSILPNSCHSTVRPHPAHAQVSPDLGKSIWGCPENKGLVTYNSPSGVGRSYVGTTGYGYAAPSYSGAPPIDYLYPEPSAAFPKSNVKTTPSVPPIKAARDFYGQKPPGYPYTCSLCHTTAYTETFWLGHVNEQRHSDGQLELLQKFPDWDCRIETVRDVTEMLARHGQQHSSKVPKCPSPPIQKKKRRKSSETEVKEKKINNDKDEDKVVCVKFARDSVSETGLKLLVKPFGEVVEFDLYHEFAFLEMRSAKEAKDTVEYFLKNPLMNSKVIRFFPVPSGKRWFRELIAAATRFGPVIDHYFLSTQVFLEMLDPKDAKKLVEHYLSAPLIIEEETVEVAFSTEYFTLKTLCSTKLLADESRVKRRRISSPRRKSRSPKRRFRSPKRRDSISHSQGTSKSREKERKREENKSSNERRDKPQSSSTHRDEANSAKPAPSTSFKPEAKEQTSNQGSKIQATPTNHSEPACFNEGISTVRPKMLVSYDSDSDVEGISVIWDEGENLDDEAMETVDETDGDEEDDEDGLTETNVTEKKLEEQESKEEVPEQPEQKTSGSEIMHAAPPEEPPASVSEPQRDGEEHGETSAEKKLEEQESKQEVPEQPEQKTSGSETMHVAPPEEPPASLSEPQRDGEEQGETPAGKDEGKKMEPKKEESKEEALEQNWSSGAEMQDAVPPVEPAVIGLEPKQDNEAQGDSCQKKGRKITRGRKVESVAALTCEQNAGRTTRSSRRSARLHDPISDTFPRVVLIKSSFEKEMRIAKIDLQSKNKVGTAHLSTDTTLKGVTKDMCTDKYGSTYKSSDEANTTEKSSETEMSTEKDVSTAKSVEKEHSDQDATGKEALPQHVVETSVEMFPANEGPTLVTPKKQETVQKTRKGVSSLRKRGKRCNARSSKAKGKLSKENAEADDSKESTEVEEENTNENTEYAKMEVNEDTGKAKMNKQTANADKDQITGYSLKDSTFEVEERPTSSSEEQPTQPGPEERTEPEAEKKDEEPMSEEDLETGPNPLQTAICSQAEVTEPTVEKLGEPKPDEEKVGSPKNTVLESCAPTKYACGAEPISELTPISVPEEFGPDEDPSKTSMDLCELSDPVGTEFVRPVVGFFCNLCKVIYADEDEAKQKHCRSLSHFKRFKEHSGKDTKSSS